MHFELHRIRSRELIHEADEYRLTQQAREPEPEPEPPEGRGAVARTE